MRAARARAIYAHSFVSHMRALACAYTPLLRVRVYVYLTTARIWQACENVLFIDFLVASTVRD